MTPTDDVPEQFALVVKLPVENVDGDLLARQAAAVLAADETLALTGVEFTSAEALSPDLTVVVLTRVPKPETEQ